MSGQNEAYQYYKESRIGIIGSDTMTSPCRASNVTLTQNVNGSSTLTFDMYRQYFDIDAREFVDNPWFKLLTNERKVKLSYNGEWHDFIIKEIVESSTEHKFSFSCSDLFITELAKNGYSIEFDTELENNSGTITELATIILDGSDWDLDENSDTIRQYTEEATYEIVTTKSFSAYKILDDGSATLETIPAKARILVFYSTIANLEMGEDKTDIQNVYFQFLYGENYETDDDRVVTNADNYYIESAKLAKYKVNDILKLSLVVGTTAVVEDYLLNISVNYRGERLVRAQKTKLDTENNKLVKLYDKTDSGVTTEYYGYGYTEYATSQVISNFILESNDFSKTFEETGVWFADDGTIISPVILPSPLSTSWTVDSNSYLYATPEVSGDGVSVINESFRDNIDNIFRAEVNDGEYTNIDIKANTQLVCIADIRDGAENPFTNFTISIKVSGLPAAQFVYSAGQSWTDGIITTLNQDLTIADAKDGKIEVVIQSGTDIYIRDLEIFRYVKNGSSFIKPESVPIADIINHKVFYLPGHIDTQFDLIEGQDDDAIAEFAPRYYENYNKIRSITESKSNRFNLIQTLCETFECWARFDVQHDENGYIVLDDVVNEEGIVTGKKQHKTVVFKNYIGEDNDLGFKYGINLSSIRRTINSDQIVTKLIVEQNSNEYGTNGICTIARADENTPKTTFIFNFDYYVQHGLLEFNRIQNDLYTTANGYLGYLYYYTEWNRTAEELNNKLTTLKSTSLPNLTAATQTAKYTLEAAIDSFLTAKTTLYAYTGEDYDDLKEDPSVIGNKDYLLDLFVKANTYEKTRDSYSVTYDNLSAELSALEATIADYEAQLADIVTKKQELDQKFYNKYSRFIQEGSWISEDYYDDNLYYLDAQSVLYTSKSPEITYEIQVVEISQVEGYGAYQFNVGDKTWIEDTEFFGWKTNEEHLTPYKEQVVVNEVTYNLDDPSQNTIRVQNFKTQFEDLFQRITATTQSVEYKSGAYSRAASAITTDGTISTNVLQNSLLNNAAILSNANDNSVVWDNQGITITNLKNPSEIVRLVSGGILLSNDNGRTWNIGITGNGISADYITTGSLNAGRINIYGNQNFPSFRWDKTGINSYMYELDASQKPIAFDYGKFIRFDRYGLYGYYDSTGTSGESEFSPTSVDSIVNNDNVKFGFVWDNFFLKTTHGTSKGLVKISSENDIQIFSDYTNNVERIKIGLIDEANDIYGIRIQDASNNEVMVTGSDGNLWLKNLLYVGDELGQNNVTMGYNTETSVLSYTLTTDTAVQTGKSYYKLEATSGDPIYVLVNPSSTDNPAENGWYEADSTAHEVFNANDTFIVYDDGSFKATKAEISIDVFTGTLYAQQGWIGSDAVSITTDGINIKDVAKLNSSGISIYGDGFFIYDEPSIHYDPTIDTEVNTEKTYYTKNSSGGYDPVTNPDPAANPSEKGWYEQVTRSDYEPLLSYDKESKHLNIVGDGTFSGTIYATDGSFTGNIQAKSGSIGGFTIEDNKLVSGNNAAVELRGTDGHIVANSITLGTGAVIKDYISLGDAYLYNPDLHEQKVLEAGNVYLNDDGTGRIGSIEFIGAGQESTLKGSNWNITNEGAKFEAIDVAGTIRTSVFETGTVQSAGGNMIFRPSASFNYVSGNIIQDELSIELNVGDWVVFNKEGAQQYAQVTQVIDRSIGKYEFSQNPSGYANLIYLGSSADGSTFTNDLLIGVNSSAQGSTLLKPEGISFKRIKSINNNVPIYDSELLFLGNLGSLGILGINGYGLYGNNVYLNGSLTTQYINADAQQFAGVNTISGVNFNKTNTTQWGIVDTSPIIFWAGSEGTDSTSIQNSKFQVSSNGSIYASQAYLTGTLITDSFIQGADIYAARLHGGTKDSVAPLTIYDSIQGIQIYTGYDADSPQPSGKESFSIGQYGLSRGGAYFIYHNLRDNFNEDYEFNICGNLIQANDFRTNSTETYQLSLKDNAIIGQLTNVDTVDTSKQSKIVLTNQLNYFINNQSKLYIDESKTDILTTNTTIHKNLTLNGAAGTHYMNYELRTNGYNLYIK